MKKMKLKPLALTFTAGGIWDFIAGILYLFVIGNGRIIDDPPVHPFYTVFLGSFFLCFSYLQILSATNISRYAMNVGCLFFGRVFYVVVLYSFMIFSPDFPSVFWFTGIIDGILAVLYLLFAINGGLTLKSLFVPDRN